MRLTTVSWFAASVLLLASCMSTTPVPTMDSGVVAAVAPACTGQAVANAGTVITDGHALNHVVVLDTAGQAFEWSDWTPQQWWPASTADAELVACVGERHDVQIQVCAYYGSDVTRYAATWPVQVFEPSTGRTVARFDVTADARACQLHEDASLTELRGGVNAQDVQSYLAGLVERGVFVPPSPSPSPSFADATDKPEETTAVASAAPRVVTLREALVDGSVQVSGAGDGLERLDIEIKSQLDESIQLLVEAGTLLEPAAKRTQRMVVLWDEPIELLPGETASASLDVACVEMHQDQPTSDDTFTVSSAALDPDLKLLLAAPALSDASGRLRQFAVWTITNDPKRNGYQPLGTSFDIFGSGPNDEEIGQIRDLFEAAGIDVADYRALR